jgi:hypothetical protein
MFERRLVTISLGRKILTLMLLARILLRGNEP